MTNPHARNSNKASAVIAGGGIGGLAAALGLATKGCRVTVLEQADTVRRDRRRHPDRAQRVPRHGLSRHRRCRPGKSGLYRRADHDGRHDRRRGLPRPARRAVPPLFRQSLRGHPPRRPARRLPRRLPCPRRHHARSTKSASSSATTPQTASGCAPRPAMSTRPTP